MTPSGPAACTPVELARLRLLSRATGCPLEQLLGSPWNTTEVAPEVLLEMVDEMERVATLLLALAGSEQDADVVQQLHTTFLLLDTTYPDDVLPDGQHLLTLAPGAEADQPVPAPPG